MTEKSDRKKQVIVGDLPDDFLRLESGSSVEAPMSQLELDEQAARSLHKELNSPLAAPTFNSSTGFVPPNTKGRLSICLVQAKLSKNYGFVKMDPYCRVRVGNTVFETPTDASGGKSPSWNRTVYCYLPQGIDSIYLEIFDERAFTTDERIAWNTIKIPEAVFNGDTIDDWYSLSGPQGDAKEGMINIVFTLYPVTAPHVAYVPVSQPPHPIYAPADSVIPPTAVPYQLAGAGQTAAQQPAAPLYTDQDIKELQEMFTNMDIEVIKSVMYEKRGNKDASINALLAIGSDSEPATTITSNNEPHTENQANVTAVKTSETNDK